MKALLAVVVVSSLVTGCSDCDPPQEPIAPIAPTPADESEAPTEVVESPPAPEPPVFGEPGVTQEVELDSEALSVVDAAVEALRHSPYEVEARVAARRGGGASFVAVAHSYNQGAEWLAWRRTQEGWDRVQARMAEARRECEADLAEGRASGVPLEEYFEFGVPDCERAEQRVALPDRLSEAFDCKRLHLLTFELSAAGEIEAQQDLGPVGDTRCFASLAQLTIWDVDGDEKHDVVLDETYVTGKEYDRGGAMNYHRVRALDFFVSSAEEPSTVVISKHTYVTYSVLDWATVGEYRFEARDGAIAVVIERKTYSDCFDGDLEFCEDVKERQSVLPWDAQSGGLTREDRPVRAEERQL